MKMSFNDEMKKFNDEKIKSLKNDLEFYEHKIKKIRLELKVFEDLKNEF